MTAPKKTKTDSLHSRREKRRRNSIPWILLSVIGLLLFIFKVIPQFMESRVKSSEVSDFERSISDLETRVEKSKRVNNDLKIEFDEKSKTLLVRESQIFPVKIDSAKVARILEMYALGLEILDTDFRDSRFYLNDLTIAKRSKEKGANFTFQEAKITILTDIENLKEFILFLQTGKISERFEMGRAEQIIETADYKYLTDNLLPLCHIESLSISESKKEEQEGELKVQLEVKFYSQLVI